jgi:hypothetical protein
MTNSQFYFCIFRIYLEIAQAYCLSQKSAEAILATDSYTGSILTFPVCHATL